MFLLALRGHQCGVQVDDQLPARRAGHRTPTRRDSFPGSSTSRPDRRNCGVDVAGQSENQPRHGGIRGHRPEHLRLGPGPPRCRRRSPHRARPRSPGRATPCQGHGPPDLNATAPTSLTAPIQPTESERLLQQQTSRGRDEGFAGWIENQRAGPHSLRWVGSSELLAVSRRVIGRGAALPDGCSEGSQGETVTVTVCHPLAPSGNGGRSWPFCTSPDRLTVRA